MNEIVPFSAPALMPVRDIERIATAFAQSRMFGVTDVNAALSLCLLAQAEGQHPAIAFRDYSIIQGKPSKKAEAMQRDFLQSGGKIEWLQLDDDCVKAKFTHPAGGSATIDWTMDRARAAGLGGKDMWKKWPRQMLRSRVISEGVRTVCPMATSGMYVPEEVRDFDNVKEPAHDSTSGEIIEGETVETIDPELLREPAAREKLDGDHTSKTALREAVHEIVAKVRKVETLDELDALKADSKRTINQALRDWPLLINGDPRIGEDLGLKGEIEKRREDLTRSLAFSLLTSTLQECRTLGEYQSWFGKNTEVIDQLDGHESREFERLHNEKVEALKNPTPMEAGAFGG